MQQINRPMFTQTDKGFINLQDVARIEYLKGAHDSPITRFHLRDGRSSYIDSPGRTEVPSDTDAIPTIIPYSGGHYRVFHIEFPSDVAAADLNVESVQAYYLEKHDVIGWVVYPPETLDEPTALTGIGPIGKTQPRDSSYWALGSGGLIRDAVLGDFTRYTDWIEAVCDSVRTVEAMQQKKAA